MRSGTSVGPRPKSERVNIRVTEANKERLQELLALSQSHTMTEVVTKALALYEVLLKSSAKGKRIVLKARDGSEETIVIVS